MNLNILQAMGRSDLFLRLEIIKKILIAINIAITWRWGILAMIYGIIFNSVIGYYLNSFYSGVLISYPLREQVTDMVPYLIVSLLMGIAVYAMGLLHFSHNWSMLLVQIATGIVVYVFLCRVFRLKAFIEIWQAGWDKIKTSGFGVSRT
jgi:hypothetical protein